MGFTIGVLRPLEQTRHEWITLENLKTHFEMARDVLLDAGVAFRSPSYNQCVPYSIEILLPHLEWICSFDETTVELDCTKGGYKKRDRFVKPIDDDGETVVRKTSRCASATYGRLGNGMALLV